MAVCYVGLGANVEDPEAHITRALTAFQQSSEWTLLAVSSLYRSQPLGPQDQPDFYNAVALLDTELAPLEALDWLLNQEQQQGRVRLRHWGERCLDLDLLLYDAQVIQHERLTIPHPELCHRSFVVVPLLEIAPNLTLPDGRFLRDISPEFDGQLQRLSPPVIDI